MPPLVYRCPAKVNLFLSVGPLDNRGYHPIRTIFQSVGLYDTLTIEPHEGRHEVTFEGATVPSDNTVTKTLRLLSELVPLPPLLVHVRKEIPMESGLGGGSSDAAGILRAAKRFARGPIPDGEFAAIAQAVGADVPFFLVGGRAKAEGYGERLTALPDAAREWLVIARPAVGCPTADAYRRLDQIRYDWRLFPNDDRLYNDFERVAPNECLDLIEHLQEIGARGAGLSGSGSAVFGRFLYETTANNVAARLRSEGGIQVWVAPTLSRSESVNA